MIYIASDLHGCKDKFDALLKEIDFQDTDELYLLGDYVDRGPEPMALLKEISEYDNIHPIMGNHDLLALLNLSQLVFEPDADGKIRVLTPDGEGFLAWIQDGGMATVKDYLKLTPEERTERLRQLQALPLFEEVDVNGKHYVMTHASLGNFSPERKLTDYNLEELLFDRTDYDKTYFEDPNQVLINGHTPTPVINGTHESRIFQKGNLIDVDCGAVYGGYLGALRLDDMKEFYV